VEETQTGKGQIDTFQNVAGRPILRRLTGLNDSNSGIVSLRLAVDAVRLEAMMVAGALIVALTPIQRILRNGSVAFFETMNGCRLRLHLPSFVFLSRNDGIGFAIMTSVDLIIA
jgi:hypothetical protein